jgi:hypothetical protein
VGTDKDVGHVGDADGEADGAVDGDGDGATDGDADTDGDGEVDGDAVGTGDGEGVGSGVGCGLRAPACPNSSANTKMRMNSAAISPTQTRETGSST